MWFAWKNTWTFCFKKNKTWTEKTFKQISNMLNYPIPFQMYTA